MTVSRVINQKGEISDATRQRVIDTMRALGYRPNRIAQGLANNATSQIGVVVPSLSNQYFGAIIEGAEQVLWEHDYQILLAHTGSDPAREMTVLGIFEENRVDGVLVLSAHGSSEAISKALVNHRAAVVINTEVAPSLASRIFTDEIASISLAIEHLLANGRHHLGYIGFDISTYASRQRYYGFELAVNQNGLAYTPDKQKVIVPTEFTGETSRLIEAMLARDPEIDALVCFNSSIAAKALQTCSKMGRRVPDEIAIIGYDEHLFADMTAPTLTTIDFEIPRQEVGSIAARLLLKRLEDDNSPTEDVILQHKLIVRDSAP